MLAILAFERENSSNLLASTYTSPSTYTNHATWAL